MFSLMILGEMPLARGPPLPDQYCARNQMNRGTHILDKVTISTGHTESLTDCMLEEHGHVKKTMGVRQ